MSCKQKGQVNMRYTSLRPQNHVLEKQDNFDRNKEKWTELFFYNHTIIGFYYKNVFGQWFLLWNV